MLLISGVDPGAQDIANIILSSCYCLLRLAH